MSRTTPPLVLHIHFWADIRNSAGSVEKVITALAAHGVAYRHMIACCPGDRSKCEPPFQHYGVEVHHFHENRVLNRLMNKMLRRGVFTYSSLVRLINRLRPAILHFHNRQELVDALVERLDYSPKVVVQYHRHFARPNVPHSANLLLFISEASARDILGKAASNKPCRVIANPLSLEVLAQAHTDNLQRPSGRLPVILFGGGANPIKGGCELIEAFEKCPAGSARLVLAGRGVDKFGVANPAIEVIGEVPAGQFFALMRSADIVAMPSLDEAFGLVAQEAMLMRKLLVTTGCGGLAQFVDNGNAVLVRPGDVESLRVGLLRAVAILDRPDELARFLDNAADRIQAFAPEAVALNLKACYDSLSDEL